MGVQITFVGDDLEEVHTALIEYAKQQKLLGEDEEAPEEQETEEETEEEETEEESTDEEEEETEDEDEEDAPTKALRAKLTAIVVKQSKKEGGPNKIRAALKKIAKVQKLGEVPAAKLKPLQAEFAKLFK